MTGVGEVGAMNRALTWVFSPVSVQTFTAFCKVFDVEWPGCVVVVPPDDLQALGARFCIALEGAGDKED